MGLDKEFASHKAVHHGFGEYVIGDAHTNTLEGWFSLLKIRQVVGKRLVYKETIKKAGN